ncbi:hypothetical protein GCM10010446_36130 [Streptomyces enissocaesilis]|uniref:MFS transporter n=1 Tax=Streptomyces enissocaesilis TaxID=332589 RepID=A0ABP6JWK6_9ACTN
MAVVSLPAVLAIARTIPDGRTEAGEAGAREELRVLREAPLLLTLVTMALVQGATFCAFSSVEPLVTQVTGLGDRWVPTVLALVCVQGMLAFGTGTVLISRVFRLAVKAPTLAGAFATAAFNVGGAVGPWAGGLAIGAGFGFRSPVWVSAGSTDFALVTFGVLLAVRRRGGTTGNRSGAEAGRLFSGA